MLATRKDSSQKKRAMKNQTSATDEFLLKELGARLARARLGKNLTQAQLAAQAGVSLRTLSRIERGNGASLMSAFIRVCRALGLAERFEALVPEAAPSPMEQLKMQGRQRRRASGRRARHAGRYIQTEEEPGRFTLAEAPAEWKWGDET